MRRTRLRRADGPGLGEAAAAAGLGHPGALEDGDRPAGRSPGRPPAGEVAAADALRKVLSPRDICPDTGLARLAYGQARALLDGHTAHAEPGTGWDLHEYRHSGLTHLGEAGRPC